MRNRGKILNKKVLSEGVKGGVKYEAHTHHQPLEITGCVVGWWGWWCVWGGMGLVWVVGRRRE